MQRIRSFLESVVLGSGFGVTLLTITAMILVIGFLAQGIHLAGIEDSPKTDRALSAARPTRSMARTVRSREPSEESTRGVEVTPSARYATNRDTALRQAEPRYIAQLIRTCDCRWGDDADAPTEGTQFRVGHTLNITAGLVEIVFACGAKAILQGPAILELQSEKSGTLRAGRMTADVPEEVVGFTVHTPLARVVTLGEVRAAPPAKLTAAADCRWADGAAVKVGEPLLPGRQLDLVEGLAEVTFSCGAKVLLQGPARFEIESSKTAILHSGKLTADVPDDLEGFKIRTPAAEVLSLPDETKKEKEASVSDDDTDVVVLSAGEKAEIAAPADEASDRKTQPDKAPAEMPKTPAKS